jgi:hypothetical protein
VSALKAASDLVAFVMELAALAAVVVAAWVLAPDLVSRIALAVAGLVVFVAVWARWLAPRAGHRPGMPWLLVAKAIVLGLPFVALGAAGFPVLAGVCGALTAAHLVVAAVNGWL